MSAHELLYYLPTLFRRYFETSAPFIWLHFFDNVVPAEVKMGRFEFATASKSLTIGIPNNNRIVLAESEIRYEMFNKMIEELLAEE